jgi:hypothetical protein
MNNVFSTEPGFTDASTDDYTITNGGNADARGTLGIVYGAFPRPTDGGGGGGGRLIQS